MRSEKDILKEILRKTNQNLVKTGGKYGSNLLSDVIPMEKLIYFDFSPYNSPALHSAYEGIK